MMKTKRTEKTAEQLRQRKLWEVSWEDQNEHGGSVTFVTEFDAEPTYPVGAPIGDGSFQRQPDVEAERASDAIESMSRLHAHAMRAIQRQVSAYPKAGGCCPEDAAALGWVKTFSIEWLGYIIVDAP